MVRRIEASLLGGGFTVTRDSVGGRQAVIGRRSRFGARALVLVAVFKSDATPGHLDRFVDEAGQYATTVEGRLLRRAARRTSTGLSVVAVAVLESARGDGSVPAMVPTALVWPVIVDVAEARVAHPGGAPAPAAAKIVEEHVVPFLRNGLNPR